MPVESLYPSFEVPDQDLWNFLFDRKDREFPDEKVIYRDSETNRAYTYAGVKAAALDFGKGLKALWEWRKGQVLGLYLPNSIDTPAITWGVHWCGGVISPANPAYTVDELAFQLKDSGARALITTLEYLPNARAACRKVGIPDELIALAGDARDPEARVKHFTSIRNISGASRYRKTKVAANDLAFLVYSSGTTGKPKGVMLSHRNIVANVLQTTYNESPLSWKGGPTNEGDKILAFLPFFHIYGLTCMIMRSIYAGTELIVMVRFDLERFCQLIQSHKITFSYVAPPVLVGLAKAPLVAKYDLSSLRMLNSGAAPLTRELVEQMQKRGRLPIKQGYGLSETSPTTHIQPWDEWDKSIGSVGKMLPNLVAKFIDPDGKEVPVGSTGELCMKGPNVFSGYLNLPEVSKAAFTEDGYFKTGDIGHVDEKGDFYITDRVKELIKYKGFQVAPAELEGLLLDHPKVDDAAVIGLQDEEQHTELPRAYLVVSPGVDKTEATKKEIADWLHQRVAGHKRLRGGVYFVDQIPKSQAGKILRRILKDEAVKEKAAPKAKL